MGTLGYPETSIKEYHYLLRDNPEEKGSQHVWGFSEGKEFVTVFVKAGQMIRKLKHERNGKATGNVDILLF